MVCTNLNLPAPVFPFQMLPREPFCISIRLHTGFVFSTRGSVNEGRDPNQEWKIYVEGPSPGKPHPSIHKGLAESFVVFVFQELLEILILSFKKKIGEKTFLSHFLISIGLLKLPVLIQSA